MLIRKATEGQKAIFSGIVPNNIYRFSGSTTTSSQVLINTQALSNHGACRTVSFTIISEILLQFFGQELSNNEYFRCCSADDEFYLQSQALVMDEYSFKLLCVDIKSCASSDPGSDPGHKMSLEFADWEWELLQRDGKAMSAWWRQHLKGCKALKLQEAMTAVTDEFSAARAKSASCMIAWSVAEKIGAAARAAGVSLFAVWQGLFAAWAHRHMDEQKDDGNRHGRADCGPIRETRHGTVSTDGGIPAEHGGVSVSGRDAGAGSDLASLARESGRVVAETIERGGNYPFAWLMREAGVENAEHLMDVMFNWVMGQELRGFVGESRWDSKNLLTVHCDGATAGGGSLLFDSMSKLHDVLSGVLRESGRGWRLTDAGPGVRSLERHAQEEEWGTGPTLALGGIVPVTFQGAVRKFMKNKLESKVVDLSFVVGGKAGDVIGMHMRRSERLVWLTYSITLQGYGRFCRWTRGTGCRWWSIGCATRRRLVCCMDEWRSFGQPLALALHVGRVLFRLESSRAFEQCYILFTSGTTGRPKGAAIAQRNVSNLLLWSGLNEFQFCCSDSMLWQSSISFDMLILNSFWPLQSMARVCAVQDGHDRELNVLGLEIKKNDVSVLFIVPSHFVALELTCQSGFKERLRCVILGGESMTRANFRTFLDFELVNFYGPTEATVGVTSEIIRKEGLFSGKSTFPVGRALANTSVRTSESAFIRGFSVGLGYQNMGQETKRRFVYDIISNNGSHVMYDTGDKLDFNCNGTIHHIGRLDDQIKINGQRVELGAVESAVLSCPASSSARLLWLKAVPEASRWRRLWWWTAQATDTTRFASTWLATRRATRCRTKLWRWRRSR
jgi:hypothetical protein